MTRQSTCSPNKVAGIPAPRPGDFFTVSVVGGPGCGKTTLIEKTIDRLMPEVHVGVVVGDPCTDLDADRMARHSEQVVQVHTGDAPGLTPNDVRHAAGQLDFGWLDLLFIENLGSLAVPTGSDLGQDQTVAVFSVAAGDDKARKHADVVTRADVVVLNKTDLLRAVPFDLSAFRADVHVANPKVELFEVSALTGSGLCGWVQWLKERVPGPSAVAGECPGTSHWFG